MLKTAATQVPHVFLYRRGRFMVLPTPKGVTEAWIGGLNDSGRFTVQTCSGNACNNYFVVRLAAGQFVWTQLSGVTKYSSYLGPIAHDGVVAGSIAHPYLAVAALWKPIGHGSYGKPQ
jgi:hypothetical protein